MRRVEEGVRVMMHVYKDHVIIRENPKIWFIYNVEYDKESHGHKLDFIAVASTLNCAESVIDHRIRGKYEGV